jgi:hypothetical protein
MARRKMGSGELDHIPFAMRFLAKQKTVLGIILHTISVGCGVIRPIRIALQRVQVSSQLPKYLGT